MVRSVQPTNHSRNSLSVRLERVACGTASYRSLTSRLIAREAGRSKLDESDSDALLARVTAPRGKHGATFESEWRKDAFFDPLNERCVKSLQIGVDIG